MISKASYSTLEKCVNTSNRTNSMTNEMKKAGVTLFFYRYGTKAKKLYLHGQFYTQFQMSLGKKKPSANLESVHIILLSLPNVHLGSTIKNQQWIGNPELWGWSLDYFWIILPSVPDGKISCSVKVIVSPAQLHNLVCTVHICEGEACCNTA